MDVLPLLVVWWWGGGRSEEGGEATHIAPDRSHSLPLYDRGSIRGEGAVGGRGGGRRRGRQVAKVLDKRGGGVRKGEEGRVCGVMSSPYICWNDSGNAIVNHATGLYQIKPTSVAICV